MTDRAALLAAILADPDDDTPREVFADWLDEHGEPDRAFVIRAGGFAGITTAAVINRFLPESI